MLIGLLGILEYPHSFMHASFFRFINLFDQNRHKQPKNNCGLVSVKKLEIFFPFINSLVHELALFCKFTSFSTVHKDFREMNELFFS